MEMSPGDLADKLTILGLKVYYCPNDSPIKSGLKAEFARHAEAYREMPNHHGYTPKWDALQEANHEIWKLESAIRNGDLTDLEEVGRRALKIRHWNRIRIEEKNKINEFFGYAPEIKIDHASEVKA